MAITHLKGSEVNTSGNLPNVGEPVPSFVLCGDDLNDISLTEFKGKKVILNVFPSVDTPTCAMSVRTFNAEINGMENTVVLCISHDLPFAMKRFCGSEGLDNIINASAFRSSFAQDYGLKLLDSKLKGLTARAVLVIDESGRLIYSELVNEIADEPNYEAVKSKLS